MRYGAKLLECDMYVAGWDICMWKGSGKGGGWDGVAGDFMAEYAEDSVMYLLSRYSIDPG
jgi:hypothetical protein